MNWRDRWLDRQLDGWSELGLISAAQAGAIREQRARESAAARVAPFTILASLGGVSIGVGIILLVAYNWENIHRGWKLAGFGLLLAGLAEASARLPRTRPTLGAATILVWMAAPLAGIGLWGQVYQLSGDPLMPLLVWLALTAPVAWLSGNATAAFVHAAGVVVAVFTGSHVPGSPLSLEARGWWGEPPGEFRTTFAPALAGIMALWTYGAVVLTRRLGGASRWLFLVAFLFWLWSLSLWHTPFQCQAMGYQATLAAGLIALYWGALGPARLAGGRSDGFGTFLIALLLYTMTFFWRSHAPAFDFREELYVPLGFLLAMTASGVLLVAAAGARSGREARVAGWLLRGLVLLPVCLGGLILFWGLTGTVAVIANLALLALGILLMVEGVRRNLPGRINDGTALLGLVIATRFLDLFGTMLRSGFAFIVAGVAFIGLAWVLNRGRQSLVVRARGFDVGRNPDGSPRDAGVAP
ncbi:MAG: DUF2157 domain-containing protein [Candidatus Coatesbacteria bacterium]